MDQNKELNPPENRFKNKPERTVADRVVSLLIASFISLIALVFWSLLTFLDGREWFDFAVKLVLHEMVFILGLLAGVLIVRAISSWSWIDDTLEKATEKLEFFVFILLGLMMVSFVVFAVIVPALDAIAVM